MNNQSIKRSWHEVVSSNLKRVYYSSAYRTLVVEFKESGEIYLYPNVSQGHARGLMNAPSKGKYFHVHISSTHEGIKFKRDEKRSHEWAEYDLIRQLQDSIKMINERKQHAS